MDYPVVILNINTDTKVDEKTNFLSIFEEYLNEEMLVDLWQLTSDDNMETAIKENAGSFRRRFDQFIKDNEKAATGQISLIVLMDLGVDGLDQEAVQQQVREAKQALSAVRFTRVYCDYFIQRTGEKPLDKVSPQFDALAAFQKPQENDLIFFVDEYKSDGISITQDERYRLISKFLIYLNQNQNNGFDRDSIRQNTETHNGIEINILAQTDVVLPIEEMRKYEEKIAVQKGLETLAAKANSEDTYDVFKKRLKIDSMASLENYCADILTVKEAFCLPAIKYDGDICGNLEELEKNIYGGQVSNYFEKKFCCINGQKVEEKKKAVSRCCEDMIGSYCYGLGMLAAVFPKLIEEIKGIRQEKESKYLELEKKIKQNKKTTFTLTVNRKAVLESYKSFGKQLYEKVYCYEVELKKIKYQIGYLEILEETLKKYNETYEPRRMRVNGYRQKLDNEIDKLKGTLPQNYFVLPFKNFYEKKIQAFLEKNPEKLEGLKPLFKEKISEDTFFERIKGFLDKSVVEIKSVEEMLDNFENNAERTDCIKELADQVPRLLHYYCHTTDTLMRHSKETILTVCENPQSALVKKIETCFSGGWTWRTLKMPMEGNLEIFAIYGAVDYRQFSGFIN